MSTQNEDNNETVAFWVVGGIVAAVIVGTLMLAVQSPGQTSDINATESEQTYATSATSQMPPVVAHDSAAISTAQPDAAVTNATEESTSETVSQAGESNTMRTLSQIYFGSGTAKMPAESLEQLTSAAQMLADNTNATLVLSGYHDKQGSASANAALAKARALAVKDALLAQGVSADRIRLEKPQISVGGSDPKLARRVDINMIE